MVNTDAKMPSLVSKYAHDKVIFVSEVIDFRQVRMRHGRCPASASSERSCSTAGIRDFLGLDHQCSGTLVTPGGCHRNNINYSINGAIEGRTCFNLLNINQTGNLVVRDPGNSTYCRPSPNASASSRSLAIEFQESNVNITRASLGDPRPGKRTGVSAVTHGLAGHLREVRAGCPACSEAVRLRNGL